MKRIVTPIVGMLLMATARTEDVATSIPSTEHMMEINLVPRYIPWIATFYRNGAAKLEFRQTGTPLGLPTGTAAAPKDSFPFEDIYNLLVPHLKQGKATESDLGIGFGFIAPDGKTLSGKGFYIEDQETMRTLMHGLLDRAVPHHRLYFEELLKRYPLLPGEIPEVNFLEETEEERARMHAAYTAPFSPEDESYFPGAFGVKIGAGMWRFMPECRMPIVLPDREMVEAILAQMREYGIPIAEQFASGDYEPYGRYNFPDSAAERDNGETQPVPTNDVEKATPANNPEKETPEDPTPVIAPETRQSNLRLYLGIAILLGACVIVYFIRRK